MHDVKLSAKNIKLGFSTFFKRSIQAKANIGVSTNDAWIWHMLLQCYVVYGKENGWRYQVNEKSEVRVMRKVSQDELDKAAAVYIIALQQFVVRGVKHSS